MRCRNKNGIRALSPPRSCCFSFSCPSSKLASISFATLSSSYPLCFCLRLTLPFFLPLSYSCMLPQAPNRIASCVREDKSVCCISSCNQHAPHTNKAYLHLWTSLEKDAYMHTLYFAWENLSLLLYRGQFNRTSSSLICSLCRVKMCEVRCVQGRLKLLAVTVNTTV